MKNQLFRYDFFGRYSYSAFLLLPVLILLAQSLYFLQRTEYRFSGFAIFQLVFILLLIPYSIGAIIHRISLRISLSESSIIFQAQKYFGWQLMYMLDRHIFIGEIPYQSIEKIENFGGFVENGNLRINLQGRKPSVILDVRYLENSPDFMNTLTSRLTQDQLDTTARLAVLSKPYTYIKFRSITTLIGLTLLISININLIIKEFYKDQVWNQGVKGHYVYEASLDSDGSLWGSSIGKKSDVKVWHISENALEEWIFPEELCNEFCVLRFVGHTAKGFPRIINIDRVVYSWNGRQWIKEMTLSEDFNKTFLANDNQVWSTKNDQLILINFDTGTAKEFDFPPEVRQLGLKLQTFKVNQDSTILALFSEVNKPKLLYRFKDEYWQLVLNNFEEFMRMTFTLDPQGRVWALRWNNFTKASHALGYFDEEAQVWKWQFIPSPYFDYSYIHDIAIDNSERIWVSGYSESNFIQVLSWSENGLTLIEEYNENNSNMDDFSDLKITKSGRLWSMNGGYWLDTTIELPKPAPDWAIEAEMFLEQYGGWTILIFVTVLYGSLLWEVKMDPMPKEKDAGH